jgi:methyl-accepting chemotaxis protein
MHFKNLKVATRLSIGFGVILLLLAIVSAVGIFNLKHVNDRTSALAAANGAKSRLANQALDNARGSIARVFQLAAIADSETSVKAAGRLAINVATINESLDKLKQMMSSPEEQAQSATFDRLRDAYVASYKDVLKLRVEGKREEAQAMAYGDTYAAMHALAGALREWIENQDQLFLKITGSDSVQAYETARNQLLSLALAALLAGLGFWYVICQSIVQPVATALRVAQTVAAGDLTSRFSVSSQDEIGDLLRALQAMNDSLLKVVTEVRSSTTTIAVASSEIAHGNVDLSGRTEQQASALEETASSMEELTSTVKQTAENARQARQMAGTASEVAKQGGTLVADVVDTMASINDSSKKIVDIIAVIDGIAFQTNILALNAAVEAARAGEQGRGFAVVAAEVRNLAQRSAGAAKEIKLLIDTSVDKVAAGGRLVDQAGSKMLEIVASVQSVSEVIGEIAAASAEQEAGIEQINRAITEMDTVTQQNAALVEQAAAAAASLQERAAGLEQVVGVFVLADQAAHRAQVVPMQPARRRSARPGTSVAVSDPQVRRAESG